MNKTHFSLRKGTERINRFKKIKSDTRQSEEQVQVAGDAMGCKENTVNSGCGCQRNPLWNWCHMTWISKNMGVRSFQAEVKAATKAKQCENMSDRCGKQWAISEAMIVCWPFPPILPEELPLSNHPLWQLWSGKILFQSIIVRKLKTQVWGPTVTYHCAVLI